MALTKYEISDYKVTLLSHPLDSAVIFLYTKSLSNYVGRIYFSRKSRECSVSASGEYVILAVPDSYFSSYIDILRNESPVYLEYDVKSDYKSASIKTGKEPAGDGELP